MIRSVYGTINFTLQYTKSIAGKNMVYAEIKTILIISKTRPSTRLSINIIQTLSHSSISIRDRRIIKITANKHIASTIHSNSLCNRVRLRGTYSHNLCYFMKQMLSPIFYILFPWRFQYIIIYSLIMCIKLIRLQMIID